MRAVSDDATTAPVTERSDIDAVAALLTRMIAEGQGESAVAIVVHLLTQMRAEIDALQHKLQAALRMLYGRKSEKLTAADQAELAKLLGDAAKPEGNTAKPEGDAAKPEGGASPSPVGDKAKPTKKPLPKEARHGRGGKPAGLPERRASSSVLEADRVCPQCLSRLQPFGHVECWRAEYEPGHFFVQTTQREQLSCRRCRDVVVTAPMPPTVIEGSEAGAGLIAKVLVDKGEDHLPLERQQRRLEREGLTVPISTLTGWWSQAADLLRPLHGALTHEAMRAWLPQVDGTGLDVLDRNHPKGIRKGTIWTAVGGRAVAFVFTPAKSRGLGELLALRPAIDEHGEPIVEEVLLATEPIAPALPWTMASTGAALPTEHEGDDDDGEEVTEGEGPTPQRRIGPVQCDGEKIFGSALRKLAVIFVLVHCWMHARRYFERAAKARDTRALVALALIGKMYEVERQATVEGVSAEERSRRRQAQSWPLLEKLRQWIEELRPQAPPSTPLGKAIRYVEGRWLSLCVFVLDGRIPLDNGEVERFIRRIGVGRHNWLFTGSDAAAARLCTVASLCATCRKLGLDPWAYLRDALLAAGSGMSAKELVADFTPWAWAEKQAQQADAEKAALAGGVAAESVVAA